MLFAPEQVDAIFHAGVYELDSLGASIELVDNGGVVRQQLAHHWEQLIQVSAFHRQEVRWVQSQLRSRTTEDLT